MTKPKKMRERVEPTFEKESKADAEKQGSTQDKRVTNAKAKTVNKKKKKKKTKKPYFLRKLVSRTFYWSLVAGIWLGISAVAFIAWHAMSLPHSSVWAIPDRPPNARIIAVDGELIANRGVTGGAAISVSDMSPYIPMAVIAIEDRRFKHHFGIDLLGLARAMGKNLMAGRFIQGGSTLTQQLAKNLFLKPERTLGRKVQEAILAIWLESRFTKNEIIELYLNRVYFGSGAYGVDAASRRYFGKSARYVNLAEAAILAAVLKAPSRLSPARNPELARSRSKLVLAAMRHQGYISDRESATALTMQAKKAKRYLTGSEHYVADMVMKKASQLIGSMREDIIISTTIDINLQKKAGLLIKQTLSKEGKSRKVEQGALVSLDGTGAIRALVGGREYSKSQFNRAINARRQPGSAFKPFVFLASLEAGRTPNSIRNDAPVRIGNWTPVNYDRKYRGEVTLTTALAKSLNTIAAQLVMETGPEKVIKLAHRLGINSEISNNASIALGTSETSLLEITSAYVPFANGGYRARPFFIKSITDTHGKVLYQRKTEAIRRVVGNRELGMMNEMMAATIEWGTGKNARLKKWPAAGKTGTSQKSRDGWFIGYTANLTTGIWFGNDDGSPTSKITGGGLPAKIWKKYMDFAHDNLPPVSLRHQRSSFALVAPKLVVPKIRPVSPAARSNHNPKSKTDKKSNTTKSQQITETIRPAVELGVSEKKPESILDLLFN
ncbi:MAG: PBP1A family penicillin-binding protein [Hyphomicrobiales bacterium]|nr:PBP1A family penicillin-binding protein [Hyphomicrobiales bacterium]